MTFCKTFCLYAEKVLLLYRFLKQSVIKSFSLAKRNVKDYSINKIT